MSFRIEWDQSTEIATLWMEMEGWINKIYPTFGEGFNAAITAVLETSSFKGLIITSGHKDFCVGADIDFVYRTRDVPTLYQDLGRLHEGLRMLETCGKPVVAAINGSALGGGYEVALACHHRIATEGSGKIDCRYFGLVAGGRRLSAFPRLIGIQPALEVIAQGQMLRVDKALKKAVMQSHLTKPGCFPRRLIGSKRIHGRSTWDQRGFEFWWCSARN